jgi:hypothetical protein
MRGEVKPMLRDFVDSIKSISEYQRFKQKKLTKVLLYLLVLSLLTGIIITSTLQNRYREILFLLPESYDSKFPNFKIEKGILTTDSNEPLVIEKDKVAIIFDTSTSADETSLNKYKKGVLLLRDKFLIKTSKWGRIEKKWSDFNTDNLDKEKGRGFLAAIPGMIIFLNVFIIVGLLLMNILISVFIAFIFTMIKKYWKKKLTFSEVYKMTVYSFTLPMVLLAVGTIFLGERISLKNYFYVYYLSCVYLILAVGRTDLPRKITSSEKKNVDKTIKKSKKK